MKYITNELLSVCYVIDNLSLINLSCFNDVIFYILPNASKCSIRFKRCTKREIGYIKYLSRLEKSFFNVTYDKEFCCANFKVPKKYENFISCTIKSKVNTLSTQMMSRFNRLQQQSLTARESSQAFFIFIIQRLWIFYYYYFLVRSVFL